MTDAAELEQNFSFDDEDDLYDPVLFDPEVTTTPFGDDEFDNDTLAFRDAVRDICAADGAFELILP